MQTLLRDLHFAARMLVRERLLTLVAVSMLALGIGANTAIFSVVNAVLLRALPYRDADRLVDLHAREANGRIGAFSLTELESFQSMQSLEGLAAAATQSVNLTGGERPARVRGAFVSANFFEIFRVTPVVGRAFLTGEDRAGAAPVAMVSERLWQERLSADASLANAKLTFNGEPHRIIGVVSGRFEQPFDPETIDVWLPVSSFPMGGMFGILPDTGISRRAARWLSRRQKLAPSAASWRHETLSRAWAARRTSSSSASSSPRVRDPCSPRSSQRSS